MVERRAGRHFGALDDLAHALSLHFEGAVVAIGVVAPAAEEDVGCPGAAGEALVGVITVVAEAPEVVARAQAWSP